VQYLISTHAFAVLKITAFLDFFFFWHSSPQWARASSFTRFLDYTQRRTTLVGDLWTSDRFVTDNLCLTTHNIPNRQTSYEERENTNKMQQSDVYYQLLSQFVSGIIMPIFRRTKTMCYCIRCTALVLLDVAGSGCGALRCRMRAL